MKRQRNRSNALYGGSGKRAKVGLGMVLTEKGFEGVLVNLVKASAVVDNHCRVGKIKVSSASRAYRGWVAH